MYFVKMAAMFLIMLGAGQEEKTVMRELTLDMPHAEARKWVVSHRDEILKGTKSTLVKEEGNKLFLQTKAPIGKGSFDFTCKVQDVYAKKTDQGLYTLEMVDSNAPFISSFRIRVLSHGEPKGKTQVTILVDAKADLDESQTVYFESILDQIAEKIEDAVKKAKL